MAWFILIVNLVIGFKLFWDHRARVKDKRIINHARSALIDGAIFSAASIYFFGVSWFGFSLVVLAALYRGLVFDLLYNLIFERKWSYCGDNSKIDELSDKLDGKDDQDCVLGFVLKVILIAITILIIIL